MYAPSSRAGVGWVYYDPHKKQTAKSGGRLIPFDGRSIHWFEFVALRDALQYLHGKYWKGRLVIKTDSRPIYNGLMTIGGCHDEVQSVRDECHALLMAWTGFWTVDKIPRHLNKVAHKLARAYCFRDYIPNQLVKS